MMRKAVIATILMVLAFPIQAGNHLLGLEYIDISGGYFLSNSRAAKAVAEELGGDPDGGNAVALEIHGFKKYGESGVEISLMM